MNSATIEQQPTTNAKMSFYQQDSEKHGLQCDHSGACHHRHKCSSRKLRMFLIFSLCLVVLGICTYLFLSFMDVGYDDFAGSLWKRAIGAGNSSDPNNESTFTRNKCKWHPSCRLSDLTPCSVDHRSRSWSVCMSHTRHYVVCMVLPRCIRESMLLSLLFVRLLWRPR
jgi:hypothetical protein